MRGGVRTVSGQVVHTLVADLDVSPGAVRDGRRLLSGGERARADRFVFELDRHRFVAARALLRTLLGRILSLPPASLEFTYGSHGKPELTPALAGSGIRFNLSHSDGRALVAWSHEAAVGADLERVRPVAYGDAVARRFFSDDEQASLRGLEGAAWDEAFFRCWTRKEAYVKAIGDGLHIPLRSFSVPVGERAERARIVVHAAAGTPEWTLDQVAAGAGFVAAVVSEGGPVVAERAGRTIALAGS
jgi:4'-phosphopantetheinyl transferase